MKVKLKYWRLALELAKSPLSLNRWAQKMGLSSGHLSELVNGKKVCPRPETRHRILQALKIPFEDLFEVELHQPPARTPGRSGPPGREGRGRTASGTAGCRSLSSAAAVPSAPASRGRSMRNIARDFRQAFRQLGRRPLFSAAVILTLTIGIGANTAIFSIVDTILWKPFPYLEPESLVDLYTTSSRRPQGGNLSFPDYLDYRQSNAVFSEIAAHDWEPYSLSDGSQAMRVGGGRVTASLFPLLGIQPLLGRPFSAEEDRPGAELVLLLGESLWKSRFGSDPEIVGKSVQINGQPRTVVGVMPAEAEFPERARLWVPLARDPQTSARNSRGLQVTARLKPGVTLQQAQAALEPLARSLEERYPETNRERGIRVSSLRETRTADSAAPSLLLLGVTAFVLLIVCANVSNLVLARGLSRERELAIRTALGAGRGDVIRQLLTENLLLAAAGGALGLLLGAWGAHRLMGLIPVEMPAWLTIETDGRVALFSLGASLAALLFFGLMPTLTATRREGSLSLKEGGLQSTASRGRRRIRSVLVVSEVALA
ncbi:MAG: ABC transporter permease, partial [Acidobacteriota bacterium]